MKKPALILIFLVAIIATLSIVRIFVSNNVATSGVSFGEIKAEADKLKLENSVLSEKVLELSSLTNLSVKAYDQGYTEEKSSLVMTQKIPVAIKQ